MIPASPSSPPDLLELAREAAVTSGRSWRIRGEERRLPANEADGGPALLPHLELDLYSRLYTRPGTGFSPPPGRAHLAADPLAQRDFGTALSAANCGRGTWEAGWRIVACEEDGRFAVRRDDVSFWVGPEALRTTGSVRRAGDACRVRVGKELRNLVPGFYVAIGDGDAAERDSAAPLLRLYWHLTAAAAVPFVDQMTRTLNGLAVPFRAKVLADPAAYVRADAGVLYVERRRFPALRPVIAELHEALASALRAPVPMFCRELAPGLGAAEDPGDGTSFGQRRCHSAAQALLEAFETGPNDEGARAAALARRFVGEGLDLANLHRVPGSRRVYGLGGRRRMAR